MAKHRQIQVCFIASKTRDKASLARWRAERPARHAARAARKIAAVAAVAPLVAAAVQGRRLSSRVRAPPVRLGGGRRRGKGIFGSIAGDLARYIPF